MLTGAQHHPGEARGERSICAGDEQRERSLVASPAQARSREPARRLSGLTRLHHLLPVWSGQVIYFHELTLPPEMQLWAGI